jgi:hypothetical protein
MPALEVVVALLRNGFCVVKSVADPKHWIMQPYHGEITCLECMIAPLQIAAVVYNLSAALPVLTSAASSWVFTIATPTEEQWAQAIQASAKSASPLAIQYAQSTLAADMAASRTKLRIMMCKTIIGTAFIFLSLASLHKPFPALINWAVVMLELALAFLLTVMFGGVTKGRQLAGDSKRLSDALVAPGYVALQAPAALTLLANATAYGKLPESPWLSATEANDPFGVAATRKYMQTLTQIETDLNASLRPNDARGARAAAAQALARQSMEQRYQTVLDFVTMLLNGVAWCGYGMFPVTYFNADASLKAWVPVWPGRDAAQYWGNLAGDFAWTVEPTLLIVVPFLIERAVASAASAAKKNA